MSGGIKYKARLVARGFQQQHGIDYNNIFALVVWWSTIRLVLTLAAKYKWPLSQLDVITAFLNGTLQEDIFMEVPDGFPSADDISKVCKVNKALYGLKQSPKAWYERIDTWLLSQGLYQSEYDPNLYYLIQNKKIIILLLYVDDLLITGDNFEEIARLKTEFKKEFEMTDLGEASTYLGAEIMRGLHGIFISQKAYIMKLLKKFNMLECNSSLLQADPKV